MASTSQLSVKTHRPPEPDEEREGLLPLTVSDVEEVRPATDGLNEARRRFIELMFKRLAIIWGGLMVFTTGVYIWSMFMPLPGMTRSTMAPTTPYLFSGDTLRSNGTHEFKRTVVMVSIDGLRASYLDRGLTPHLLDISKKGLRARSMRPIFPTLTFPNHWALMTGLYAESHGIVANEFWDPVTQETFHYNRVESAWKSKWWLGEPMWETAEKAGVITANLMWPGPPKTSTNTSSTYFVPWRDHVPLGEKLDQILQWIDLPLESRPQLIVAYEPSLDQAGHSTGPNSARVNATLVQVDSFAKDLNAALEARNLTNIVDIVFVSDHGMTDTSDPEVIYLDDILGTEGVKAIHHVDGWPAMGLRFREDANITQYLSLLLDASAENPEKFKVYTTETMPKRFHFSKNERIAPIWVVPKIGYILTTREQGSAGMNKGSHGYDNRAEAMQAMFVAHGPFSHHARVIARANPSSRGLTDWFKSAWNGGCHSKWQVASKDTYIMNTFQNVEIYNLIMKLLGIEHAAAPNNGTVGFWDQYL